MLGRSSFLRCFIAVGTLTAALASFAPERAHAQGYPREAMLQAYRVDTVVSAFIAQCRTIRAPGATRLQASFKAWRAYYRLENLASQLRLSAEQQGAIAQSARDVAEAGLLEAGRTEQKKDCAQFATVLRTLNPYEPEMVDGRPQYTRQSFPEPPVDGASTANEAPTKPTRPPPEDDEASSEGGRGTYRSCDCSAMMCPSTDFNNPYANTQVFGCHVGCYAPKRPNCLCGTCYAPVPSCQCTD